MKTAEETIEQLQLTLCTHVLYPKQQESLAKEIYYGYIKPLKQQIELDKATIQELKGYIKYLENKPITS